jgi:hypothetical protein
MSAWVDITDQVDKITRYKIIFYAAHCFDSDAAWFTTLNIQATKIFNPDEYDIEIGDVDQTGDLIESLLHTSTITTLHFLEGEEHVSIANKEKKVIYKMRPDKVLRIEGRFLNEDLTCDEDLKAHGLVYLVFKF